MASRSHLILDRSARFRDSYAGRTFSPDRLSPGVSLLIVVCLLMRRHTVTSDCSEISSRLATLWGTHYRSSWTSGAFALAHIQCVDD